MGILQLGEMLNSAAPETVDIIFDTGYTYPPVKGILFNEWNAALRQSPQNLGVMVVCNGIPFAMTVASIYGKLLAVKKRTLVTAKTVDDARQLLEKQPQHTAAHR